MPSGAPTDADYVLVAANGQLPNARLIDASGLLVFNDGGPGGVFEISAVQSDYVLSNLTDLDTELATIYIAKSVLTTNGDLLVRSGGAPARLAVGTDGQVLTVSSGAPSWQTPASGGAPGFQAPMISGIYYGPMVTGQANDTVAASTGAYNLVPFYVPYSQAFDRIGAWRTTASAADYHLGIYGPATNSFASLPLILDSGQISVTGSGLIQATISQTLAAGWYLLCLQSSDNGSVQAYQPSEVLAQLGWAALDSRARPFFRNAGSYGSLPSNSPSSPAGFTSTNVPVIALRAA